jgi:topoisomerase IA-like protein
MEERLDQIASGEVVASEDERVAYLDEFYAGEHGLAAQVKRIEDMVDANEARRVRLPALEYEHHEVLDDCSDDDEDDLSIAVRAMGKRAVSLFVGPWGPYVQHVKWEHDTGIGDTRSPSVPLPPQLCADISAITPRTLNVLLKAKQSGGMLLGTHPEDGRSILLKTGRYGSFLQWGEDGAEGTTTHSLPKHKASATMFDSLLTDNDPPNDTVDRSDQEASSGLTMEEAVGYISLPRTVSHLNDLPITASLGPYGPYLKFNSSFLSLDPQDGDVLTIDKDTAERLVTDGIINGKRKQRGVVAELGEKEGSMVIVKEGRFGRYINWKKVNAKIPSAYTDDPSTMPLEKAWALIEEKKVTPPSSRGRKGPKPSNSNSKLLPSKDASPPPPKRPLSAYLHFCSEKAKTESSFGAVAKKLSQLWAESSPDDRQPYEAQAASDKVGYEERKRAWEEECINGGSSREASSAAKSTMKPKGAKRRTSLPATMTENSSGGPKRPKSAYLYFCEEQRPLLVAREQSQQKTLGEIAKELGKLWSETTNRSLYDSLAAADKQRYNKEKEEQQSLISA